MLFLVYLDIRYDLKFQTRATILLYIGRWINGNWIKFEIIPTILSICNLHWVYRPALNFQLLCKTTLKKIYGNWHFKHFESIQNKEVLFHGTSTQCYSVNSVVPWTEFKLDLHRVWSQQSKWNKTGSEVWDIETVISSLSLETPKLVVFNFRLSTYN